MLLLMGGEQVFAQIYGEVFDKDRSKKRKLARDYDNFDPQSFDRYSYEQYLYQLEQEKEQRILAEQDSINQVLGSINTTPEELRKLGVDEALIEQLSNINELQDSLANIGIDVYKNRQDETGIVDSLSIGDIQVILELQKQALIEKALSLPEAYVYGHEFFRKNVVEIIEENEIKIFPPDNYILGEGDKITIAIWGKNDLNSVFSVDEYGTITLPLAGKLYVEGLSYKAVRELITQKVEQFYGKGSNTVEVTVTYSKMVNVNVVGEVFNPGTYRFPSINSAFNVLIAMEGPNNMGSVRNIFVRRNGEAVANLDVYQYLLNPDSKLDFFLTNNDYLFVPPIGDVVNISGEVRRPQNYEIKDNEGLLDVIDFGGGLNATAYTKNINVKRYEDNREVLYDINLDSLVNNQVNFELLNGDSIFVYKIPPSLRNYVEVTGAVRVPGKYQLKKGDRISDILYKAEGPIEEADLKRAYVLRLNEESLEKEMYTFDLQDVLLFQNSADNILLNPLDTILVLSKRDFRQDFLVNISGEVNNPGEFEYSKGMTLRDLINMAGGFKREASNSRLEISRMAQIENPDSKSKSGERIIMRRIDIDGNLQISEDANTFEIKPFDRISVRMSPDFEIQQNVQIYGEILYPGEYSLIRKDERVASVIDRAGGMTDFALDEGAQLYRKQDSLGYVIVDLEEVMKKGKRSRFNYILTEGDSLFIPKVTNIVTLKGSVGYFELDSIPQINVPYMGRKSAKKYIKRYGAGFGRWSKRKRTYVQQPNGRVQKARNFFLFKTYPKVEPGATVFVDLSDRKKNEAARLEAKKNRDWNDAFDGLTSKIATILTILVLVQQSQR